MNSRLAMIALFSVASAATPAFGQFGFANFTLTWSEVDATTHVPVASPNGSLEPGEAARLNVSVAFSPIGSVIQTGPGTVAGFAFTGFSLYAGVAGSWSDIGVPIGFVGTPIFNPNSQTLVQQVWQPAPPLAGVPIATNPIPWLWSVVWNPPNYQQRTVPFGLSVAFDAYPELFLRTGTDPQGNPLFVTWEVGAWNFGSDISVPIVPSLPVPVVTAVAIGLAARRRKQMHVLLP